MSDPAPGELPETAWEVDIGEGLAVPEPAPAEIRQKDSV